MIRTLYIGLLLLIIFCFPAFSMTSETSIKSLLGVPFGEICIIRAEFIDKPNTYYAQNMSQAGYYLKITEINKRKLPEPLIAEPVYKNINIQKNKVYTLKAFETIQSQHEPSGWANSDIAAQFYYNIIQKVVIKEIK